VLYLRKDVLGQRETISRVLFPGHARAAIIYLGRRLPVASSGLPGTVSGRAVLVPTWPCSRQGLPSQPVARLLVGTYPTGSPLPCKMQGGMFSVVLSVGSLRLGVTQYRCSVEPGLSSCGASPHAIACSSLGKIILSWRCLHVKIRFYF